MKKINTVLDNIDSFLASNPVRSEEELVMLLQAFIGNSSPTGKVYVPDSEAPVTPETREAQISGPLSYAPGELTSLSSRSKTLGTLTEAFVNEISMLQSGLQTLLNSAASTLSVVKNAVNSPNGAWMEFSDRFLDTSKVNTSSSTSVNIGTNNFCGVSINPSGETDLTSQIASLTVVDSRSSIGSLPGDNLELSSIQDQVASDTPAAGSASALTSNQQAQGNTGGTGQEPVVTFTGDPDLHADISVILGNSNQAYFDFEKYYVPLAQPCNQLGTAYVYNTGGTTVNVESITDNFGWTATVTNSDGTTQTGVPLVQFVDTPTAANTDGSVLTLTLNIDLGAPTPMNELNVTVRQVGSLWPTISGVEVSLDNTTWYDMLCQGGSSTWQGDSSAIQTNLNSANTPATGASVNGTSLWEVSTTAGVNNSTGGMPLMRYVNVVFTQPQAYTCAKGIGHPYYVEVVNEQKSSSSWFGLVHSSSNNTTTTRYPTDEPIINVTTGVIKNTSSSPGTAIGQFVGEVAGAAESGGNSAITNIAGQVGAFIGSLWGSNSDKVTIEQVGEYDDVLMAYRQVISLVQVQPLSIDYPTGVSAQLITNQYTFPQAFSAIRLLVDDSQPQGTSILYELSFDSGNTWQTITATEFGISTATSNIMTLSTSQTTVILRATLSTTMSNLTPRLLGYAIDALPDFGV